MFRKRFHLDPVSLRYVQVRKSLKTRLKNLLLFFLAILPLSVFSYYLIDHLGINPKVNSLESLNEELIVKFSNLHEKMDHYEDLLHHFQVTDDSIYRCILELDPVPSYAREGGTGGTNPFTHLVGFFNSDLMINTSIRVDQLSNQMEFQVQSFSELHMHAQDKVKLLIRKPSIQPISLRDPYWVTSVYGVRTDPITKTRTSHYGVDFAGAIGTSVYATGEGVVKMTKISNNGYGKEVVIDHGFGYTTRYAHLHSILVHTGQQIRRGTLIGTLGNSGKSTGPHLHYEVRQDNKPRNPYYFFSDDLTPGEYEEIISISEEVDN